MKQEASKRFSPGTLTGMFQSQAGAAIPANLDLWPELRRELERQRLESQKVPEQAAVRVFAGIFEEWMEEVLEPNQVWISLTCYKGHEQDAARALREAFAAVGILEQILDIVFSPKEAATPFSEHAALARMGQLHEGFIGTFMAKVAQTNEAAAVLRSGNNNIPPYSGWEFKRNMSRAREIAATSQPGEIPFRHKEWVRVLSWPFENYRAQVRMVMQKINRILVSIPYNDRDLFVYLDPFEIEQAAEKRVLEVENPERAWYVLHGYPGKEAVLRDRLRERLFDAGVFDRLHDIIIPAEGQDPITLVKDGKVHSVYPTLFPGAVFMLMSLNDTMWDVIRQTPGLTGFVGMGNKPLAYHLAPGSLNPPGQGPEQSEPGTQGKPPAQPGDKIRILSGPFYDFRGVVIEVDEARRKLRVVVDFFNKKRPTPVEIGFDQVEKV